MGRSRPLPLSIDASVRALYERWLVNLGLGPVASG